MATYNSEVHRPELVNDPVFDEAVSFLGKSVVYDSSDWLPLYFQSKDIRFDAYLPALRHRLEEVGRVTLGDVVVFDIVRESYEYIWYMDQGDLSSPDRNGVWYFGKITPTV